MIFWELSAEVTCLKYTSAAAMSTNVIDMRLGEVSAYNAVVIV